MVKKRVAAVLLDSKMTHIADDAHDLGPVFRLVGRSAKRDVLPDGTSLGEEAAGKRLVHDIHPSSSGDVRVCEPTTLPEWDAECFQIRRRGAQMPCAGLRRSGRERVILQREGVNRQAALERRRRREAGSRARDFLERGQEPLRELLGAVVRAVVRRQCHARGEDLCRVETGVD